MEKKKDLKESLYLALHKYSWITGQFVFLLMLIFLNFIGK